MVWIHFAIQIRLIAVKRTSFFDLSHDLSHFFAYFDVLMTYDVATKKSLTLTLTFDVSQRKNDNFPSKSIKIMTTLYFFVVC